MLVFATFWTGNCFSECGALQQDVNTDPSLLDQPVFVYTHPGRIVFTTVEGDEYGAVGSSFIAVLD